MPVPLYFLFILPLASSDYQGTVAIIEKSVRQLAGVWRYVMGEAKRRKKLDPNYGKSNPLKDACRMIDDFLSKNPQMDQESHFLLFTNKDRGCTEQEIEILQKEIPLRYQGKRFTTWVLPKKYAHLPPEEGFDYFVRISVGMSEI